MNTDDIEIGDYVKYHRKFWDGIAVGMEMGAGYVVGDHDDQWCIRNGDRFLMVPKDDCEMHAKQYRLNV